MAEGNSFHIVDYIIFSFVVMGSFFIGIYQAVFKKNDSTGQYLMADRKLKVIPTAISLLISFISAISILGNAAETYFYGVNIFFILVSYVIAAILSSIIFVPMMYPLKLTSVNEYLKLRYRSRTIVHLAVFLQILVYIMVNGIVLYGPAIMINSMTGVEIWVTMLGLGLLATVYTSIGGFKAVIWSDVFQGVFIFGGLLAIVCVGTYNVGGIYEVWSTYAEYDRLQVEISPWDRSSAMAFVVGLSIGLTNLLGTNQISVQRYCALPSLQAAKKSVLFTIPVNIAIQSLTCSSGVVVFAYYAKMGCDPYQGGIISGKNEILPHYVMDVLNYPSIPGMFVACVFCGSLSNLSSSFSGGTAMIWQDVLRHHFTQFTEQRKTLVTKIISFIFGILSIISGFVVSNLGGTLIQLTFSLLSIFAAPLITLSVCGALSRRPNAKCIVLSALAAFCFTGWLSLGAVLSDYAHPIKRTITANCSSPAAMLDHLIVSNGTEQSITTQIIPEYVSSLKPVTENEVPAYYRISFAWYMASGLMVGVITSTLLSCIPYFCEDVDNIKPEYIFPFVRALLKLEPSHYKAYEADGRTEPGTYTAISRDDPGTHAAKSRDDPGTFKSRELKRLNKGSYMDLRQSGGEEGESEALCLNVDGQSQVVNLNVNGQSDAMNLNVDRQPDAVNLNVHGRHSDEENA